MIICITSQGDQWESKVDQRFGRCQYFVFIDTETSAIEAIRNENVSGMGGVGIRSGQLLAEKQAKVVLTGKVGPNAAQTLESAGIAVIVDVDGTVKEVFEHYQNGEFTPSQGPNAQAKSGLNET
jgi:predicted Fe-Mo cluster-binding NifX family protein